MVATEEHNVLQTVPSLVRSLSQKDHFYSSAEVPA